jgi:hypothetical protein
MTSVPLSEAELTTQEQRTVVQRKVLEAVYAGQHTMPLIHHHVAESYRAHALEHQSDSLAAAYLAHTGSAQATTRKAVYQLLDLGILRRDGETVVLA